MYFNGDIIMTDPMYIVKCEDDWHRCAYGENLEALQIFTYMTSGNGDEFATDVVCTDTGARLGEIGSDSCMISVMLLSEVLRYNPDFARDLEPHCCTIIKDFDGEVQLFEMEEYDRDGQRFYFEGKGNRSFRTDFY